ncbi:MFS transporter [Terrarubrum flagellatum]|uniref:MFS transporter n=1 Tax=Terrirubrum flagellatum TaxID=2895980 RepID=UPI00314543F8
MSTATISAAPSWRTPLIIALAGAAISFIGFGPRSVFGFFLQPISNEFGWSRSVFALTFALQQLFWGIGQPFAGAIADRFGTTRVLIGGAVLYMAGLALMTVSSDPILMHITGGVLIGFALAGCSFNVVLGAFAKLLPPEKRGLGLGLGTAAGSFGQFVCSPFAPMLVNAIGWKPTLYVLALTTILIIPLAFALWTAPAPPGARVAAADGPQSLGGALSEAFAQPSYVMLVLGFFTCGFQLAFITGHLPQFLVDRGLDPWVGGVALGAIGLTNIMGSLASGWLMTRCPRRYMLAIIYALRSVAIIGFMLTPVTTTSAIVFGLSMGLLWLSTVPPTSGLVALMFGVRYMTMLYGFAFFSHQVGGFFGAWLGGVLYEQFRSYDIVWWLSVALGFASAAINLPIREKAVERAAPAAA